MPGKEPRTGKNTKVSGPPKGGHKLLYWIANTCRLLRDDADASIELVAAAAGESARVLARFEDCDNWPRELEVIVAAYAEVAGLKDSLAPWEIAFDLWHRHGELPTPIRSAGTQRTDTTEKQIMDRIRRQAQQELAARVRPGPAHLPPPQTPSPDKAAAKPRQTRAN